MKGVKYETDNLGQQFKNLTLTLIRVLECSNVIHGVEKDRMRKFNESCGSLEDFREVFKNKRVRDFCVKYFSSSYVVKKILESDRTQLRKKIVAIKYLKSLLKITHKPLTHWKPR